MIIITVTRKGHDPSTERFDRAQIRIGREPDNELVLASPMCSRYHAELVLKDGIYTIADLGSTNGLRIDDSKVSEATIEDGLVIGIGDFTLEFTFPKQESPKTMLMEVGGDRTMAMEVPAAAPVVLYIHYVSGGQPRNVKIASGVEYVIGRSAGTDIMIEDRNCSGRHAQIFSRGVEFFVRDLESSNGTAVNGQRIQEAAIAAGDSITVGAVTLSVDAEPRDSVDDDILLARTMGNVPIPHPPPLPSMESAGDVRLAVADRHHETQERGRRMIWIVATLVAIAVVAALAVKVSLEMQPEGVSSDPTTTVATSDSEAVTVQVGRIATEELEFTVTGAGSVTPQKQVTASAEIAARVVETPVSEGQRVTRRDVLVRLDDTQIRLQLQEARSAVSSEQVDIARADYERKQRLFDDGAA
ncbi:MAG: FHA domain-containing protein, partial [bacterium]|nr:FHA domain-containing protein [bacterium]